MLRITPDKGCVAYDSLCKLLTSVNILFISTYKLSKNVNLLWPLLVSYWLKQHLKRHKELTDVKEMGILS